MVPLLVLNGLEVAARLAVTFYQLPVQHFLALILPHKIGRVALVPELEITDSAEWFAFCPFAVVPQVDIHQFLSIRQSRNRHLERTPVTSRLDTGKLGWADICRSRNANHGN